MDNHFSTVCLVACTAPFLVADSVNPRFYRLIDLSWASHNFTTSHFVGYVPMILNKTQGTLSPRLCIAFLFSLAQFKSLPGLKSFFVQKTPEAWSVSLTGLLLRAAVHLNVGHTCWPVSESVVPSRWGSRSLGLHQSCLKQWSWGCLPVSPLPHSHRSELCRMEAR